MPQPTQPDGEIKLPKKTTSRVALWGWNVQAMEACCDGSVMHFWKVLVGVSVVQWEEIVGFGKKKTKSMIKGFMLEI